MGNIELKLVSDDSDRELARQIVENHHSYVPTFKSVGRRIDWLVYIDDELCGMIGIGSSTYPPCKDILRHLGMSKDEYKTQFNSFANNWRFCMMKSVRNAGTRILKMLRKLSKVEWKRKYGDDLKYLITFVGAGHNGAVYRADNWDCIGKTSGLPSHKSVSMKWDNGEKIKEKFVKPTGENSKLIFIRKL